MLSFSYFKHGYMYNFQCLGGEGPTVRAVGVGGSDMLSLSFFFPQSGRRLDVDSNIV